MFDVNFYANKKILITGGLGFVGSNLAQSLVDLGADITLIDNLNPKYGGNLFNIEKIKKRININICDVRDINKMECLIKNKDYLFNLAGQTSHIDSMNDPFTDLEINAAAQLSILEVCRKINQSIKIVFASTRQVYGVPDYLPVNETHPVRPVDVNGINKLAGEWYHLLYSKVYGLRSCALRLTNTYGPGMRVSDARQTFLGIWIRNVIEGKEIEVFGDGRQLRDFNFVTDCVEALLLAGISDDSNGKIYNLGSDEVINLKNLAELINSITNKTQYKLIPFPADRKAIDIGDYYSDFSLITKELGWRPKTKLIDGLIKTIDFYEKNHSHYWSNF